MSVTEYSVDNGIAVLTLNSPPVNSLGRALRAGVIEAVQTADKDPAVKALVIHGANGTFSAGADIAEFGGAGLYGAPWFDAMIDALDAAVKPLIAAIEGHALGGGLELALGCHYRVAQSAAKIGLPEVGLGLIPGAAGTQRFPRLVGIESALKIIPAGGMAPAKTFAGSALLDRIVDADVKAEAIAFAREVVAQGGATPRVRDRAVPAADVKALCQAAREQARATAPHLPAPLAAIDAIEASAGDYDAGVALENQLFRELMDGPVSKALRHAFFAERATSKVEGIDPKLPLRPIKSAAIVGAGTMGGGIAICFLDAGIPVTLLENAKDALDRGVERIRGTYDALVKKGRMTPEVMASRMGALKPTLSYDDLKGTDIVVEAVFEEMSVKLEVFKKLDAVMKPGAILATNTSMLDINVIAKGTSRPGDVVGMHFFSPANIMKLVEVIRGTATAPDVLATTMKLSKTLKKVPVVCGVCDGFIGNRMMMQYMRQAEFMVEEGATPQQVDQAIEKWGLAMGPFRMCDMAGNDVFLSIRTRRRRETPDVRYSTIGDHVCAAKRYGQKSGSGWYDYKPGDRKAYPSDVVAGYIEQVRGELGIAPRQIPEQEIVDRLLFALINEGALILAEGISQRASDIDAVYLTGYGFPSWRGGPMLQADLQGLDHLVARMREFAQNPHADPKFWRPAPRLVELAKAGKTFNG
jgi:3-hydroxyacyl-CoA dehydrogenase